MQCLRRWTPWLALGLAWGALAQPPDAVGLDGEKSDAVAAASTGREPLRFAQLSRDELFGTSPADKAAGGMNPDGRVHIPGCTLLRLQFGEERPERAGIVERAFAQRLDCKRRYVGRGPRNHDRMVVQFYEVPLVFVSEEHAARCSLAPNSSGVTI